MGLLTYYQENLLNYPTFFYDFICFVGQNMMWVQQVIKETLKEIRNCKFTDIVTPRFIDTLAIMSAEIKIFYGYAVSRRYMSESDAGLYMKQDMEVVRGIIAKNDNESRTKSPATLICLALRKAMESNMVRSCTLERAETLNDFRMIAIEEAQYIYILPETLWYAYREYCKNIGDEVLYRNGRDLSAPLRKENVLLIKTEGKNQQLRATHKIGNFTSKRFFCIKKEVLKTLIELYEKF